MILARTSMPKYVLLTSISPSVVQVNLSAGRRDRSDARMCLRPSVYLLAALTADWSDRRDTYQKFSSTGDTNVPVQQDVVAASFARWV